VNLVFETTVPAPREGVFAFHATPANLPVLLAGWAGFRLLRHDGSVRPGSETWTVQSVAGIVPLAMGFRHGPWEPPARFEEGMIHGPFARFHHRHEFEECPEGTRVRDRIEILLPWWFGAAFSTRRTVGPALRRFFAFRHASLGRLARSGALDLLRREGA